MHLIVLAEPTCPNARVLEDRLAAVLDDRGRVSGDCGGPSASVCCGHVNFFATRAAASAWAASHREITGGILSQARALHVGISISGQLLR